MNAYALTFGYGWQMGGFEAMKGFAEFWAEQAAPGPRRLVKHLPTVVQLLRRKEGLSLS